ILNSPYYYEYCYHHLKILHLFDLIHVQYFDAARIVKGHVISCQSGVPSRRTEPNVRLTVCGSEERSEGRRERRVHTGQRSHGRQRPMFPASSTPLSGTLCW